MPRMAGAHSAGSPDYFVLLPVGERFGHAGAFVADQSKRHCHKLDEKCSMKSDEYYKIQT
jgi:hypothetical protein